MIETDRKKVNRK